MQLLSPNISETCYLLSMPILGESIKEGMQEPVADCSKVLNW